MTCESLIFGQIKNVAMKMKGKTQTEQEYCGFRGVKEVEENIRAFPYLLRVQQNKLSCKRVRDMHYVFMYYDCITLM